MNIQSIDPGGTGRADVLRVKHRYGILYGVVLGLGFAIFNWGIDAFILSNYHGMHPYLRFIAGMILCMIIGGAAGWISAKLNRPLYSIFIWLVAASAFAWLSVNLTVSILPKLLAIVEPQTAGLIKYVYYESFRSRFLVGYIWIAIFTTIAGVLQIPLSDSAVFSTSIFGKVGPLLVATVLMGICGTFVDYGVLNEPLRASTAAVDNSIQFILDNRGKDVDKTEARRMHAGAFRAVIDSVTEQRELIVSEFDTVLGELHILVKFENDWVECQVIYNQTTMCKMVETTQ